MKKALVLAVTVFALAIVGVAGAGNGNGAVTTHFTAAYVNIGGNWTCHGEHIVGPASNPSVTENEECTIDNLAALPAGTYVGNPGFPSGPLGGDVWFSDFNGVQAQSVSLKVTPGGEVVVRASY